MPAPSYTEVHVTLPSGFEVAVELDENEVTARWRLDEHQQWVPVDAAMVREREVMR